MSNERVQVQIEYCMSCGYLPVATRVAEEILSAYPDRVQSVTLVPSSGGRFIVTAGDRDVYNNTESGRFPEEGEVRRLLGKML